MKGSQVAPLRQELKDSKKLLACAKEFGIVGDATRLKICYLLCCHPELSVSEIADVLGVSVSRVSHSLRRLRDIDLVRKRKSAQVVYYSLRSSPFSELLKTYLKAL